MKSIPVNARVIITYARSLMSLSAAKSLSSRGIEIIGCDDVDMTVLHFSKTTSDYFVHEPYEDDVDAYLHSMKQHINDFRPADNRPYILIPMFRDAKILSKHKDEFEGMIDIAVPEFSAIEQVTPKDNFARSCQTYDVCSPQTIILEDDTNLDDVEQTLEYPILIKPIDAVGGRGISKVNDRAELDAAVKKSVESFNTYPLLQEVIDGEDYCVAVICDEGQIIQAMAYKNLHTYPKEAGAGVMRETIDVEPFMKASQTLMQALKWHGIAEIDFRWTGNAEDDAYMIEVNPRFWMGLFHSVDSGADFPWMLYQLVLNDEITDINDVILGHKTKIPGIWMLSAMHDVMGSDSSFQALQNSWSNIWSADDQKLKDRLMQFSSSVGDIFSSDQRDEIIKRKKAEAAEANSEFDVDDDPHFGFGVLFILSSLLRHGKLPPEIKYE